MATILAHIRVKPGTEAEWESIARELFASTHEHETGVRRYEYWRGSEPRTYYTLLSFDDFRTFIAHQTSEHHETASPKIGACVESLRLEWVDPVEGASDLPPTASQDVPDDADELTNTYAQRFAAQIADWWPPRP
jgi:quinol monooxygenase YgiN